MHVHLPTGDWVCGCVGHYGDSIERYFGSRPEPTSAKDFIALYERLGFGRAGLRKAYYDRGAAGRADALVMRLDLRAPPA